MIPVREERERREFPWVTFTLLALFVLIYVWDRKWSLFGPRIVFTDLAVRPVDVVSAFRGGERDALTSLFASAFLHANLYHLLGNVIYLWVFGPRIEERFGPFRYAIYYLIFGVSSAAVQIAVTPHSGAAMLGASGAIAGVMGCYFLFYPASRIEVIIPPLVFFTISIQAWILLGIWFLFQIFIAQPGVANWAHAGGFLAGMLLVMVIGRKEKPEVEVRELDESAI